MVNWVNLQTNTAPSTFIDSQAANLPARYYRVVLALAKLVSSPVQPPQITSQPSAQTIGIGRQGALSVGASGSGLAYQWRLNGADILGATGSSLSLKDANFGNAGLYTVVISNGGGAVTSAVAVVNISPELSIAFNASRLTLTWQGSFTLQSAPSPGGPFQDVAAATSPYTANATGVQAFFRLRPTTPNLTVASPSAGQTSISVTGSPGTVYLIQSSADLVTWTTLATNTVPCTVTIPTSQSKLFYRAVPAN
jgi:hypothetical protein